MRRHSTRLPKRGITTAIAVRAFKLGISEPAIVLKALAILLRALPDRNALAWVGRLLCTISRSETLYQQAKQEITYESKVS